MKTKISVDIHGYSHINDHVFRSIEQINSGEAIIKWNDFLTSIKLYASRFSHIEFVETSYKCHILEYGKDVLTLEWKEVFELNDKEADIANLETQEHLS